MWKLAGLGRTYEVHSMSLNMLEIEEGIMIMALTFLQYYFVEFWT